MSRAEQGRRTRAEIISTAARLVHKDGFRATSLNDIIKELGLTKGALLHHFNTKLILGYAIVDEYLYPYVHDRWVNPVEASDDPIGTMCDTLETIFSAYDIEDINLGCPITNLATEMSPLDEGFRIRLQKIYDVEIESLTKALLKGQKGGVVRPDVDVGDVAYLFVSFVSGSRSVAKNAKSKDALMRPTHAFIEYLKSLRV
ncbi:MAG: TetR/AcrR family transcriptional regulator [Candidatus Bathyarchaeota archaeon]|nr:TetR/AcrR family transcriptional regulator [Candidatus Bathyarchaeota archaeon]